MTRLAQFAVLSVLAVATGLAYPAPPPASGAADPTAGERAGKPAACGRAASRQATAAAAPMFERVTLCLLNHERTVRGLGPLRVDARLRLAGLRHARDMTRRGYFGHTGSDGSTFLTRIRRTFYLHAARAWVVGENLGWGAHAAAAPARIVRSWMASPAHRENILHPSYREVGIAIVGGAPQPGFSDAATYATEFGAIRR